MLYKRPKGVRYVDMAIYIDNHIYTDDYDPDLVFQYLYHLVVMLSYKYKFFNRSEYYEEFAIHAATDYYMRLTNPKQYIMKEDGTPKLKKVKSILNYIKSTLYPRKVDFEQKFYSQAIVQMVDEDNTEEPTSGYLISDVISKTLDGMTAIEFDACLSGISGIVYSFVSKLPYKVGTKKWNDIYLSCLLSLLSMMTLPKKDIERINSYKNEFRKDNMDEFYKVRGNLPEDVILYHLNENMRSYIFVLVNEIKHLISKQLTQCMNTYVPTSVLSMNLYELNNIAQNNGD